MYCIYLHEPHKLSHVQKQEIDHRVWQNENNSVCVHVGVHMNMVSTCIVHIPYEDQMHMSVVLHNTVGVYIITLNKITQ